MFRIPFILLALFFIIHTSNAFGVGQPQENPDASMERALQQLKTALHNITDQELVELCAWMTVLGIVFVVSLFLNFMCCCCAFLGQTVRALNQGNAIDV